MHERELLLQMKPAHAPAINVPASVISGGGSKKS